MASQNVTDKLGPCHGPRWGTQDFILGFIPTRSPGRMLIYMIPNYPSFSVPDRTEVIAYNFRFRVVMFGFTDAPAFRFPVCIRSFRPHPKRGDRGFGAPPRRKSRPSMPSSAPPRLGRFVCQAPAVRLYANSTKMLKSAPPVRLK